MSARVLVETDDMGWAVRIFLSDRAAYIAALDPLRLVVQKDYDQAVYEIRHQIFVRSKGECELCGVLVNESSGQMHEMQHRGKGGEISLSNSVFICYACHLGPRGAHGNRRPRFGEK